MPVGKREALWAAAISGGLGIIAAAVPVLGPILAPVKPILILGAVMHADADTQKRYPISEVEVSDVEGLVEKPAITDDQGGFRLNLKPGTKMGSPIRFKLYHRVFGSVEINEGVADKLYTLYMPTRQEPAKQSLFTGSNVFRNVADSEPRPETVIVDIGLFETNVSVTSPSERSATFEIANRGNIRCRKGDTCSPDGKWKAAIAIGTIDAQPGEYFTDATAECVAGPCPFTHVESLKFKKGDPTAQVEVRNWSDTATYVLTVKMLKTVAGRDANMFVPTEGKSFDFDVLSPENHKSRIYVRTAEGRELSQEITSDYPRAWGWATCEVKITDVAKYHCKLRDGYRFVRRFF